MEHCRRNWSALTMLGAAIWSRANRACRPFREPSPKHLESGRAAGTYPYSFTCSGSSVSTTTCSPTCDGSPLTLPATGSEIQRRAATGKHTLKPHIKKTVVLVHFAAARFPLL